MATKEIEVSGLQEFKELIKNPSFRTSEGAWSFKSADSTQDEIMKVFTSEKIIESQPVVMDSLSLKSILPDHAFMEPRNIFTYPVFSLAKHSLNEPIEIIVETDESDNVVVWNEDFGVSGIGNNKEEALDEFEDLIYADYNSLKDIPQRRLSEGAKELLMKYRYYLG